MTIAAYSQTPEGLARAVPSLSRGVLRAEATDPTWDIAKLKAAAEKKLALPNPGGSPGCSPILREILIQSGLAHVIDAEVVQDTDMLGHQGGNALDVMAPDPSDVKLIADLLMQMHALFNLVAYTDAKGVRTLVWMGAALTSVTAQEQDFAARCTDHVHVASTFVRLKAGLAIPPTNVTSPAARMGGAPATYGIPVTGNGIVGDRVYVAPVGDGIVNLDARLDVL